jgi:hypothetical protein
LTGPKEDDCRDLWPRNLTMIIAITAFERSPDGGKGLARDVRVRWALEEVGQPYEEGRIRVRLDQLSVRLGDAD